MIVGVGTDLVSIRRMRDALHRSGQRLVQRLLHESECRDFDKVADKAAFLARRFAAKEAASKALGTGIGVGARFTEIEIAHDANGAPLLRFHGAAARTARPMRVMQATISGPTSPRR